MSSYLVIYDRRPGVDYGPLHKHLESYPTHWRCQQSAWVVGPASNAFDIAEAARQYLDGGDYLFVQALTADSAWWGYEEKETAFFRQVI